MYSRLSFDGGVTFEPEEIPANSTSSAPSPQTRMTDNFVLDFSQDGTTGVWLTRRDISSFPVPTTTERILPDWADYRRYGEHDFWFASLSSLVNVYVISVSTGRISRVATKDSTIVEWFADSDFDQYKVKIVPSEVSLHTEGFEVELGAGGSAGVTEQITITDDELVAAEGSEGSKLLKVFVRDLSGNWSV